MSTWHHVYKHKNIHSVLCIYHDDPSNTENIGFDKKYKKTERTKRHKLEHQTQGKIKKKQKENTHQQEKTRKQITEENSVFLVVVCFSGDSSCRVVFCDYVFDCVFVFLLNQLSLFYTDYRYTMYIHITLDTFLKIYHLIYMCTLCVHLLLLKFTSSWDFVIFREYWISMDIKVKMQYLVQCTRTRVAPKNLSVMVRTGFALDQPSINGIGPINPSEKMKRSETVGNMIRPKLVQPAYF